MPTRPHHTTQVPQCQQHVGGGSTPQPLCCCLFWQRLHWPARCTRCRGHRRVSQSGMWPSSTSEQCQDAKHRSVRFNIFCSKTHRVEEEEIQQPEGCEPFATFAHRVKHSITHLCVLGMRNIVPHTTPPQVWRSFCWCGLCHQPA